MPLDRRHFLLQSGSAAAVVALFGQGCAVPSSPTGRGNVLGFTGVPASLRDGIVVPPEYEWQLLYPWGTPTGVAGSMPAFAPDAGNSADDQAVQAGMHHDGMHFFALDASGDRGLLVMNHEYTDEQLLHTDGVKAWTAEKVRKSLHAMGVSVIEIRCTGQGWQQVRPSPFARRVHGNTPMRIAGPAARHAADAHCRQPGGRRGVRHLRQLRNGRHALGHLPHLRGKLPWLFRRPEGSGSRAQRRRSAATARWPARSGSSTGASTSAST